MLTFITERPTIMFGFLEVFLVFSKNFRDNEEEKKLWIIYWKVSAPYVILAVAAGKH